MRNAAWALSCLLCVAVETAEACREAARRVKIDFEVKKPLMNVRESMAEGAEQIEPHLTNNNIVRHRQVAQGDMAKKPSMCSRATFSTQPMQHVPIEPTACLCDFSDGKHLTVYSNSQTVFQERRIVAEVSSLMTRRFTVGVISFIIVPSGAVIFATT